MLSNRKIEILVGCFIASGLVAVLFLALKVANSGNIGSGDTYQLLAKFDNVGGLKVRSPIKIGGVVVGRVSDISIGKEDFLPVVTMDISVEYQNFPDTSTVSILTAGLLGEQYLGLEPGFMMDGVSILKSGDTIFDTKSALVLEELIGQFLFSQSNE